MTGKNNGKEKRMKFLLLLTIVISMYVKAEESLTTPQVQIVTAEFPPFSFKDEKGKLTGVMTEVVEQLMNEVEHDGQKPALDHLKIDFYPWKRAYKMATEEKNVLLFPLGMTPERNDMFQWIGPRMDRNIWIYSLHFKGKNLKKEFFHGVTIGMTRGYSWTKDVESLGAIVDESTDDQMLLHKMVLGRTEFIAIDEDVLGYTLHLMKPKDPAVKNIKLNKVYPLDLNGKRTFGFSKNTDPQIYQRFSNAYKKLEKNGVVKKIMKKYDLSTIK
jgi:polar amino acid transport system substrate-binding protein